GDLQDLPEQTRDLGLLVSIQVTQDPDDLAKHERIDVERLVLDACAAKEPIHFGRLEGIVLRDVSDQNVGVQPPHAGRRTRRRIAAFICSTVRAACPGRRRIPFNSLTSIPTGRTTTEPSFSRLKSSRSPARTRSASRTALGIVTWPLLVTVALGISAA